MSLSVYSTAPNEAHALHQALARNAFLVVGLCAAWCDTCTEFRAAFDGIAASQPNSTFVWLDIEDDAEIAGDIDVDNFPTLAVFHHGRLLHFGVSLPQAPTVARLLAALTEESATAQAEPAVEALPRRLQQPDSQDQRAPSNASSDSSSSAATN